MNFDEVELEYLWGELLKSVENREEIEDLRKEFEDPTVAARMRADEISRGIIEKYGKKRGNEIIDDVTMVSMGGFFYSKDDRLIVVETGVRNPSSKSVDGMSSLFHAQESPLRHLMNEHGVKPEDLCRLSELGACRGFYLKILSNIKERMQEDLYSMFHDSLPKVLRDMPSINPTPGYSRKSLVWKIEQYCAEYSTEEMETLATVVNACRQRGYVERGTLPEAHGYLLESFRRIRLLDRVGETRYALNESGLNNSTVLVQNCLDLNKIQSLSDVRKVFE